MSNGFDKLVEQVPIIDGGFRRKVIAGVIISIAALASGVIGKSILPFDALELGKSGLLSPIIFGALCFLLAYAIGGIVEVISSLYFKRIAGNVLWSLYTPFNLLSMKIGKIFSLVLFPFQLLLVLLLLPIGIITAIFKPSFFEWEPNKKCVGTRIKNDFEKLPEQVVESLKKPFGELSDLSWEYFSSTGTIKHQKFSRKLRASMSDMILLISSITFSLFFFLPGAMDYYLCDGKVQCPQPQDGTDFSTPFFQYLFFIFIIISCTLGIYASLVKQSIVMLLEHQNLKLDAKDEISK